MVINLKKLCIILIFADLYYSLLPGSVYIDKIFKIADLDKDCPLFVILK